MHICREITNENLTTVLRVIAIYMLLYGSECWTSTKRKMRMETAEVRFLKVTARHRVKDHKHDEDVREEMGITDINIIISK